MKRLVSAGFLISVILFGQGERGAFTGTITDASGSAVPNATITVTHLETNIETKAIQITANTDKLASSETPSN